METEDRLQRELAELNARVDQLQTELAQRHQTPFVPPEFYGIYYGLAGAVLGFVGALASLIFNIVGSVATGNHPLKLIQIYLTFPMGADAKNLDSGLALAIGCCLYLLTGMALGIPIALVLYGWFSRASFPVRFVVVTVISLGLWLFNFYAVLAWLQPRLFGGNWIVEEIPWFVAAATHLVFGWTILILQPMGRFIALKPEGK